MSLTREALQTALAAMDERDALAAEGRLLRGALETCVSYCETDGQLKSYLVS